MKEYKISHSMRLFFAVSGSIIWLGIWLSGFSAVHWLLYVPACFFAFAVITGICPGMIVSKLIMKDK